MFVNSFSGITKAMTTKNQEEKKDITLAALAREMREGFKSVHEKLAGLETYTRSGFETMNDKIDVVDNRLEYVEREVKEMRGDVEELKSGMFTPFHRNA